LIGIWLVIYGGMKYQSTFFIAAQFLVAAIILIILFSKVYPYDTPEWAVWLTIIGSLCAGGVFGYIA
jgi:hypothetical protein